MATKRKGITTTLDPVTLVADLATTAGEVLPAGMPVCIVRRYEAGRRTMAMPGVQTVRVDDPQSPWRHEEFVVTTEALAAAVPERVRKWL